MAFPQVATYNTSTDVGTTHTISYPASISSGDLLLCFFATDGDNSVTNWDVTDDWTEIVSGNEPSGKDAFLAVAYRKASGSEGSSFDITTNDNEKSAHVVFRITGAEDPAITPPEGTLTQGDSDTPDPPNHNTSAGTKDYLWIAAEGNDDDDAVSAYPYADNNRTQVNVDPGGCNIAVCTDELTGQEQNPGTFTIAATEEWVAATIAVYPDSGAGSTQELEGTITVQSGGLSPKLALQQPFGGTIAVVSAGLSPNLQLHVPFSSTINAVSSVAGDMLGFLRLLAGTITSVTTTIANINLKRPFAGQVDTQSSVQTPQLQLHRPFSGQIDAQSSVLSPYLQLKRAMAAVINAVSTVVGDLEAAAGGVLHLLEGTISAVSGVTGSIWQRISFAGLVSGVSTVSGGIWQKIPFSGTISTLSTITGGIVKKTTFSSAVSAVSTASASLHKKISMTGIVSAISSVTGSNHLKINMAAVISAISGITGGLSKGGEVIAHRVQRFLLNIYNK